MARIAGIDIPREKRVEIALTYVYGIGLTRSKLILANTGVSPDIRVKDLSLLEYIDADRDLKTISSDIKQKMA